MVLESVTGPSDEVLPVSSGSAGSSAGCGVVPASVGGPFVSSSGRAGTGSVSLEPLSRSLSLPADFSSALASSPPCSATSSFSGVGVSESAEGPSSEISVSRSKVS